MEDRQVVIFDWGRTLHDPETDALFRGVPELIAELSRRYTLALVSLARRLPANERRRVIEESGIAHFFKLVFVTEEDKNEMYEKVLSELNVEPAKAIVVDDRTIRGVAWGNRRGATTIWLRQGKFAAESPNEETGEPSHIIANITELRDLLL
ncbi:MAG: HAD family hydrolase [bacterium]|nr:HAD family hydrolase [bacterium]